MLFLVALDSAPGEVKPLLYIKPDIRLVVAAAVETVRSCPVAGMTSHGGR